MSVAHRADVEAELALDVTLLEELLHDAVRPLSVQLQRLGRVAEVGAMDHVL